MKVVIDFTGYYIKNKFMIKEFCRSDVLLRKVRTEKIIITKHPTSSECPSKREYDNYYNKYGIKKFIGHASLESLREYISSIFKQKLIQNSIYVRNPQKIQLLNEFMGHKFGGSVKCLTDFGFNTEEIVTTTCKYHDRMYSYCAQNNALVMANWLMEKNSSAVQTSKYIDHLVLDFAGHINKSQQFVIKELSLYGLSGTGDVVYQKSYVFKSYGHYDKLQPEEKRNFDDFYNTHGIQWLSGTQILGRFKSNFNKLLINSGVKFIYVRDSGKKNILTTIIGDAINVICLDRFNYQEVIDKPSNCGQHSHEDSGGADPERMTPQRVEEYITDLFSGTGVLIQVISDEETLLHEYPLFAAVNRAASIIPRHRGRIIYLTYEPQDPNGITETLLFVGKGVTYDTGGTGMKESSALSGGSRHKCGIAACVGFMQVVNLLQPPTTKVVAALCVIRNSTGENGYVADEVITAKSGWRVRITDTDVEGRLSIADALFHIRKIAVHSVNPHIFTVASVTTYAKLAPGYGYTIAIDNAVARSENNAEKLEVSGDLIGDPFEVSRMRREDFAAHLSSAEGDDIKQSSNVPITRRERCQQSPVAFLIMTSALDKHGLESEIPLKFTFIGLTSHLSMDRDLSKIYQGSPILGMSYCYLIQGKCLRLKRDPQYRLESQTQYVSKLESKPVPMTSSYPAGIAGDISQNPQFIQYPLPIIPYPESLSEDPCADSDKCEIPRTNVKVGNIQNSHGNDHGNKRNGLSTA
ncbi:Similar to lap-2: Putative aminopeptidase W07G4.4 (Caenorhabditis elegans) [Cotesia congregata]|uniref:Similar to lap-2: Putative aminopeptidase W07G4.4 (Caenorhabditis elegans) n=1 Tax=Cotesia congregata TaxID=51543 RepID=A0A8J2H6A9_COTCN|nr:Similar to lap-2: Putative aminopeptidase W07G4.4 (Caenorhabditis elegans) [Cotesia congregata]